MNRKTRILLAATLAIATGCGSVSQTTATSTSTSMTLAKSAKRGIAYDLATAADLQALSSGVSWWYNWSSTPNSAVPANYVGTYSMDFYPVLWNFNFNKANAEAFIRAHSEIKYLLVLNEPNVSGQATCGSGQQLIARLRMPLLLGRSTKQLLPTQAFRSSVHRSPGAPNPGTPTL